ncbi:MAG TPA: FAD:protein FMN transferase [Thermoanaerobaculia bacterium]|nr:FAD:protein FMN transferase [Thermoanaerobaculia bacterium]
MALRLLSAVLLLVLARPAGAAEASVAGSSRVQSVVRARYLMGTVFRFEVPDDGDARPASQALEAALDEVQRLESLLSNWQKDSEVSLLNGRAGGGETPVSADLLAVLESAIRWAAATHGAFDPTVEPLTRRTREGGVRTGKSPEDILPAGRTDIGWQRIRIDRPAGTVSLPAGGGLDFGGIAKGYALDRAARILLERGFASALLDAGGQILARGHPPDQEGWLVAVADPMDRSQPVFPVMLRDVSMATSGNSERPGEIVDPRTGRPVAGRYSAVSFTADATSADALSTALFVMGPRRGTAWAKDRKDCLAMFLEPGEEPADPLRVEGSAPQPSPDHVLLIIGVQDAATWSVHAENR